MEENIVSVLTKHSEDCNSSSQTDFELRSTYATDFRYYNSFDTNIHFIYFYIFYTFFLHIFLG